MVREAVELTAVANPLLVDQRVKPNDTTSGSELTPAKVCT